MDKKYRPGSHSMHIEWKRDPIENRNDRKQLCLAVVLIADTGNGDRPGLAATTLLGSVEERFITARIKGMREFYRGIFWTGIDKSLDQLPLEPGERATVEAEISQKISRPGRQWALWGVTCNSSFGRGET